MIIIMKESEIADIIGSLIKRIRAFERKHRSLTPTARRMMEILVFDALKWRGGEWWERRAINLDVAYDLENVRALVEGSLEDVLEIADNFTRDRFITTRELILAIF